MIYLDSIFTALTRKERDDKIHSSEFSYCQNCDFFLREHGLVLSIILRFEILFYTFPVLRERRRLWVCAAFFRMWTDKKCFSNIHDLEVYSYGH